jgi:hypothetical protein
MKRTLSTAAAVLLGVLAAPSHVAVAVSQSASCDAVGGNIQAGNVCHARVETPTYLLDFRFGTDYPDDQAVSDYLIGSRDWLINAARAPGATSITYQMFIDSSSLRSGSPPRGTQSLVLRNLQSIEGAPDATKYKCFNFDLNAHRPVTFDNLFVPGTNPMDAIYQQVAPSLARQFVQAGFHLSPKVGLDPATYQNFAITDETVTFFFDTGQLLPRENGYFFVPVPRAKLPPLQLAT